MQCAGIAKLPRGFPNVLLQAGAMKKPVNATDINCSNEIVIPDETGLLVPAYGSAAPKKAKMHAIKNFHDEHLAMRNMARKPIHSLY